MLVVPAFTSAQQSPPAAGAFRTVRGRVVVDEPASQPLRRVRIVLSGANVTSSPAYTDEQGRFELVAPAAAAYSLSVSKAGYASQTIPRPASATEDLQIRLARGSAVTGRVIDQYGDPLFVRARVRRIADEADRAITATDWTTESDDLGEFRVGSLPAGRYEVTLALNNPAMPAPSADRMQADAARGPTIVRLRAGEEVSLSLVQESEAADARGRVIGGESTPVVADGGTIRGRVITADSRPVGGAYVMLFQGFVSARQTTSASDGTYEFTGLPAGTYRVNGGKVGAWLAMAEALRDLEVIVRARQVTASVNLVLGRPAAIAGTVLDESGEPVEGLQVQLLRQFPGAGRILLQPRPDGRDARTDDRGRYRLTLISPGEYYLSAGEEPQMVKGTRQGADTALRVYYPGTASIREAATVAVGQQDSLGVNIRFVPHAGARVFGYAFDASGQPLTFPVTMTESSRAGSPLMSRRETLVGKDGSFAFQNVPPGDYVIHGVFRGTPERPTESGLEFVSVAGGDVPPVTIRTTRGTTIKGRVVLDGDTASVRFEDFAVGVYPSDLDYAPIGLDLSGTGIEEDGTFELHGRGPLRIQSRAVPEGWWLKSVRIGGIDATEEPYTFSGQGEVTGVVAIFADDAAEIGGRVRDARGQVVRNATVLLFPVDQNRWYLSSRYLKLARAGTTVDEGAFRITTVPPGDYYILALDRFDVVAEWQDPRVLAAFAPQAQRVTVTERQRLVRDLPLVLRPR